MGYKPLQDCRYRSDNCTCTHPEMGVVKLLWWNLGNRQCFLVNQSKQLTCSVAEPTLDKTPSPSVAAKKTVSDKTDVEIPVVNLPVFKYPCQHRSSEGVCSKLNLVATHGTNICTETEHMLSECPYHDNYIGYVPGNKVTHPSQTEPLKESDIFRIKIPEEVSNFYDAMGPVIMTIRAEPDAVKPNGNYSCNNKPCGLGKSHDAFYGCPTCGIRIFVKNTHSGGSM